ncbi:MAG: hypothetical protein V4858_06185 [Pseudomonadota bacterium]
MKLLPDKAETLPAVVRGADTPPACVEPVSLFQAFFSFRYSRHDVQMSGDRKAHVTSKSVQFSDGRITSESFEGTLPAAAYDSLVQEAQRLFTDQTAWFFKPFSCFLPVPRTGSGERDA